ncbi:MAG: hypothetical protein WCB67_05390 [Solirubrobacteraceae bacterium]
MFGLLAHGMNFLSELGELSAGLSDLLTQASKVDATARRWDGQAEGLVVALECRTAEEDASGNADRDAGQRDCGLVERGAHQVRSTAAVGAQPAALEQLLDPIGRRRTGTR